MMHILPCDAAQRHRSCDTYPRISPQLRAAAEDGRIARAEQTKTRHEGIVTNAIRAGKFGPARRDAWLNRLRIDEEDALADLNSIPEGLIPVTQIGDAGTTDEDSADRRAYGRVYGN